MIARLLWTLAALGFAIATFCGAGATLPGSGIFFLCVAAFIWFGWKRIRGDGPGIFDAFGANYVERNDSQAPKVPEHYE